MDTTVKTYDSLPTRAVLFVNPIRPWVSIWAHRQLLYQFIARDILTRYKAQRLGLLWSVINPLVMLAVYTFVFGSIFNGRWAESVSSNPAEYALTIFCGLILMSIFGECMMRAPGMVIGYPSYVKKVVFPLEILPVMALGSALVHAAISFVLLIIACIVLLGGVPWTLVLMPLVMLPLLIMSLAVGWLFAGLGVFLRDIGYALGLVNQVLMFVTPVFYSIHSINIPWVRTLMEMNPLSAVVESARKVAVWGQLPDWLWLGETTLFALVMMQMGYLFFMKSKKAFADVI